MKLSMFFIKHHAMKWMYSPMQSSFRNFTEVSKHIPIPLHHPCTLNYAPALFTKTKTKEKFTGIFLPS